MCSATAAIASSWNSGYTLNITVTNTGSVSIKGWTIHFTFPGTQTVGSGWNATVTQSGSAVTATSMNYNGALAPGQSTTLGMNVNGTAALPTGITCTPVV